MKEYSLSKHVLKRRVYALVLFSCVFSLNLDSFLADMTPGSLDWSTIVSLIVVISGVFLIVFLAKGIYEPAVKISNDKIEIKTEQDYNFWETTWANLSHVEVKTEHIDNITGNQQYEYVYLKKPVMCDVRFLGLRLWKTSKKGFRLDSLNERARGEIKARLL